MSEANFRTFVVVNPRSGGGRTEKRWSRMSAMLQQHIGPFDHGFTRGQGDATRVAREALEKGYEMVVAVGGDGTFSETANGFFRDGRPTHPDAVLGLLPAGTGCDFPRTMGTPRDWEQAIPLLAGRRTRTIDVGSMRFTDHDGGEGQRVFINVLSFGAGGEVTWTIDRTSKRLPAKAAFFVATLRAMWPYVDRKVRVREDGGPWRELAVTNYCVCNCRYFGAGMMVAPDARPDDGRFDITVWTGFRLIDFVTKQKMVYDGTHVKLPGTSRLQATTIEAASDERVRLDCDGENVGTLPIRIELVQSALRVKV